MGENIEELGFGDDSLESSLRTTLRTQSLEYPFTMNEKNQQAILC